MKKYPFSVQKHAHDIEFRINRIFCLMHDAEVGEIEMSATEYDQLDELNQKLCDLRDTVLFSGNGKIVYLTGEEIGLAKETVLWASEQRAQSLIESGKTEFLRYC